MLNVHYYTLHVHGLSKNENTHDKGQASASRRYIARRKTQLRDILDHPLAQRYLALPALPDQALAL